MEKKSNITDLIEVSRKYGSDPDWVLAGGGNTSMKEDGILYVKASGFELASIKEEGFVKMSMDRLGQIWTTKYPADEKEREAAVLEDMMAARLEGESARPSVEALLHSLFRGRLVVHTHPALVNGLTCGRSGEQATREIFGDEAVWVPLVHPGYILANEIKKRIDAALAAGKPYPKILLLQNHGLFVSGETPADIEALQNDVRDRIEKRLDRRPDASYEKAEKADCDAAAAEAEKIFGKKMFIRSAVNPDILAYAETAEAFEPLRLPFNPDQIVYSGPGPVRADGISGISGAAEEYASAWKRPPQGFLVKGTGLFAAGETEKKAATALALLLDSVKIAVYSDSFGGAMPMTDELIIFIRDWEVEHYRAKVGGS